MQPSRLEYRSQGARGRRRGHRSDRSHPQALVHICEAPGSHEATDEVSLEQASQGWRLTAWGLARVGAQRADRASSSGFILEEGLTALAVMGSQVGTWSGLSHGWTIHLPL